MNDFRLILLIIQIIAVAIQCICIVGQTIQNKEVKRINKEFDELLEKHKKHYAKNMLGR